MLSVCCVLHVVNLNTPSFTTSFFVYRPFLLKLSYFAVTFDNEEGSLGTQNHTFSRETTNGPVQLAGCATEFRSGCCNSGFQAKNNYSERHSLLEPEHWNTSSTTNELSHHQDTHIYTPSSLHCFYAARLHLICLAVFVRIMLTIDYGVMFGEVSYPYVNCARVEQHVIDSDMKLDNCKFIGGIMC